MTQEDRELLLKDIYARLPYGIFVKEGDVDDRVIYTHDYHPHIETCKPYFRPMSSMTEEEFQELHSICPHSTFNKTNVSDWIVGIDGSEYGRISRINEISKLIDWIDKNMFDYRGLIEKGLALEAPEGMYETK